jgi:hypothetical protein
MGLAIHSRMMEEYSCQVFKFIAAMVPEILAFEYANSENAQ